jgi:hypothetical protein
LRTYFLFKKYYGGSRNGLITLVESINIYDHELGGNYTFKEYSSKKTADEDGWKHEEIVLKPRFSENFDPIVLRDEESVGLKVIGIFEAVLFESGTVVNN